MSDQIIKLLEYMGDKVGVAIDWTQENVMPYVEDLVKRFITLNIVECILGIALFLGLGIVSIILWKFYCYSKETALRDKSSNFIYDAYYKEINFGGQLLIAGIAISAAASVIGTLVNISELIKWIIVPEFQIVKEIAYMIQPTV